MFVFFCLGAIVLSYQATSAAGGQSSLERNRRSEGAPWDYGDENGPETWSANYPDCAGKNQSPIEFTSQNAQEFSMAGMVFNGYDVMRTGMTLANNGRTVLLRLSEEDKDLPYIESGGLGAKYTLQLLVFHWGTQNSEGSEHVINNRDGGRALELDMIHSNPEEEKKGNAGLAVLGLTFKAVDSDNYRFKVIADALDSVIYKEDKITLAQRVSLKTFLPNESDRREFYRYNGSMTIPPCTENVIWSVFSKASTIGNKQMDEFRKVMSTPKDDENPKSMAPNFRPVQPLNGRSVDSVVP